MGTIAETHAGCGELRVAGAAMNDDVGMPLTPGPLPDPLRGRAFSVSEARTRGVSRGRLSSKDLVAPFPGVRAPTGDLTHLDRCRALATRLSVSAAFSHTTAARLHNLPLPSALACEAELHVTVPAGTRAPRGAGVRGHQAAVWKPDADRRTGVFATTPERTFCELAGMLSLGQLVAVGDQLVRHETGLLVADDLRRAVERYPGRRGLRVLRRALELLDGGSESPKESELRVILVNAFLPSPVTNLTIFDTAGRFVARVDLAYPDWRIAIEYEGDHHRDKDQWRKDIARRRRLEALGWVYLPVTQADLDDPRALLADLRQALGAARARAAGSTP